MKLADTDVTITPITSWIYLNADLLSLLWLKVTLKTHFKHMLGQKMAAMFQIAKSPSRREI